MAFLRALLAGLMALILTAAGVALTAPTAVGAPAGYLYVGPPEQPETLTLSAFQVAGVEFSGTQLPSGSVDLYLDKKFTGESFTVTSGALRDRFVRFPDITLGLHTFTLRQGTTDVATREVNVLKDPFLVYVSTPWVSVDTLQNTGVDLNVSGLQRNGFGTASLGSAADPYEIQIDFRANDDGMATIRLRNTKALASLRMAGTISAGVTAQTTPQTAAFAQIHVTEPAVGTADNGSRITGSGFEPGDDVTWSYVGANGSVGSSSGVARADASGSLVFDSVFSGTADVTLSGTVGSVTARALVLKKHAADPLTPAQIQQIGGAADAAKELDAGADAALAQLAKLIRNELTYAQRQELLVQQSKQREEEMKIFAGIRDGFPQTPAQILPITATAGGLTSVNVRQAESVRSKELKTAAGETANKLERLAPQDKGTTVEKNLQQVASTIADLQASVDATTERAVIRASDPELVGLGTLPASGIVTVDIPADFRGLHHIGLIDEKTGLFTVWQPVMVSPPAATPPVAAVADATSKTSIMTSGSRQVRGSSKRVKITATVRTTAGARANGTVELVVNGKVVAKRALGARTGRRSFTLPKRTNIGTARVRIRYRGAPGIAPSRSKTVKVRVVR